MCFDSKGFTGDRILATQVTRRERNQLDAELRSAFGENKALRLEKLKEVWKKIEKVVNLDRLRFFLTVHKKKLSSCCKAWVQTKLGQLEAQFFIDQKKLART